MLVFSLTLFSSSFIIHTLNSILLSSRATVNKYFISKVVCKIKILQCYVCLCLTYQFPQKPPFKVTGISFKAFCHFTLLLIKVSLWYEAIYRNTLSVRYLSLRKCLGFRKHSLELQSHLKFVIKYPKESFFLNKPIWQSSIMHS